MSESVDISLCANCNEKPRTERGETCGPKCAYALRSRRHTDKLAAESETPLEEFEKNAVILSEEEESFLKAQVRKLRRELTEALGNRYEDRLYQEFVASVAEANKTASHQQWKYQQSNSKRPSVLVAQLSDLHFEEVVDPRVMNYQNAYNPEIARCRLKNYFNNLCELALDHLGGFNWDGLQLVFNGDFITGRIHEELVETNAMSPMRACVELVQHLRSGLLLLSENFKRVSITCNIGNHARITDRWSHKSAVELSFDWLIYSLVQQALIDVENVSIYVSEAVDSYFDVYGFRFASEHGNLLKGNNDALIRADKAKRHIEQSCGNDYDYLLIGDKHAQRFLGSVFVNGSVIGFNEFARDLKLAFEIPQQQFLVIDPKHGITIQGPIFVQSPNEPWMLEREMREAA